jgi:TolB-like protein/Tfp pilus assembly protein PilF
VLPFDNLSPGDDNDMLATGVTSTLTAALAQVPELEVISRRSAQHYKGRDLTARQIAKELDVDYVLDGTVQRDGGRVRITTELVDGATGRVVWSEKYRRTSDNLLAVEDEIALKVMVLLQVKLTEGQQAAAPGEATQNLEAYLLFVRAQREYRTYTKRGMRTVRRLAGKIHTLDPNFAPAYLLEAASYVVDARLGYTDAAKSLDAAYEIFKKMASLDGHLSPSEEAVILVAKATIEQNAGNFDKAIAAGEKALALAPNNVEVLSAFGTILYFAGDFDRSIAMFRHAMRLQPTYPSWFMIFLARCYVFKGDTDEAIKLANEGKNRAESDFLRAISATNLVFAYYEAGRVEEAKREASEIKRFMHSLSVESLLKQQRYRNEKDKAKLVEALKQSGLT